MRHAAAAAAALSMSLAVALASGCDSPTEIKVAGRTLVVAETSYGGTDYFCEPLANGQYLVVLSDFALCAQVRGGMNSRQIFHTTTETNLRLVFPSKNLTKIPVANRFTVGTSDCKTNTAPGTQALATFSHATTGNADYDLDVPASSGTITLLYPDAGATQIKGSYDLTFGGDHVSGSFVANRCDGIATGFGN